MGIKGDMQAYLSCHLEELGLDLSYGKDYVKLTKLVEIVLNSVDDPNFAYKYAERQEYETTEEYNKYVSDYYHVIRFLKEQL